MSKQKNDEYKNKWAQGTATRRRRRRLGYSKSTDGNDTEIKQKTALIISIRPCLNLDGHVYLCLFHSLFLSISLFDSPRGSGENN